jgi:hypothetical protein
MVLIFPTMSMSGPKTGWRAPAACRISSSVKQHLTRPRVVHFCILRAFGALQKEVWWKSVRLGGVKLFASSRVRGLTHCGGMAHVQAIHNPGHTTNMT